MGDGIVNRVTEEIRRTTLDSRAVIARPLPDWVSPCRWRDCAGEPAIVVNGDQLCELHAPSRIARLLYDAKIAALVDLVRYGGFEPLREEVS